MLQTRHCCILEYAGPCPGVCWELGAVSSDTDTKRGPACPGPMKCSASLVPIILVCQSGLSTPLPGRRKLSLKQKQARKLSRRTGTEDEASAATPSGEYIFSTLQVGSPGSKQCEPSTLALIQGSAGPGLQSWEPLWSQMSFYSICPPRPGEKVTP